MAFPLLVWRVMQAMHWLRFRQSPQGRRYSERRYAADRCIASRQPHGVVLKTYTRQRQRSIQAVYTKFLRNPVAKGFWQKPCSGH